MQPASLIYLLSSPPDLCAGAKVPYTRDALRNNEYFTGMTVRLT